MSLLSTYTTDSVALVSISRPGAQNRLNRALVDELRACVQRLNEDHSVRAVVLSASGSHFCGGVDLESLPPSDNTDSLLLAKDLLHLMREIRESPLTWIAAVQGPAFGAGLALAVACDLLMADREHASFAFPETQQGLIPALAAEHLILRIGERHARDLLLSGRTIKARTAQRIGLVNELSEGGQAVALAGARGRAIATQCSRGAVAATKRLLNDLWGMGKAADDRCLQAFSQQLGSGTYRSAWPSLLAGKSPDWQNE